MSVEVWSSLVLPAVKTSAGCYMAPSGERSTVAVGPVQCTSCLMVLAGCLRGAKNDKLQPFLKVYSNFDNACNEKSTFIYCVKRTPFVARLPARSVISRG